MILTIPYNPSLPGGYEKFVASIMRNGKHPGHTLFVTALPQHEDGAFDLSMKLKDYFGRFFAIQVEAPAKPETPVQASNRAFLAALHALQSYEPLPNEMPEPVMLYMDPTWRPTKQRWLDEFHTEYYIKGTPVTFGNFETRGDQARVVGPVVISRRFLGLTKLLDFLPADTHWRGFLAWEFVNHGLQAEAIGRTLPAYIRPFDP